MPDNGIFHSAEFHDQLEALIDKSNFAEVLDALSEIAGEKSEHLASNWQDKSAAREFNRASDALASYSAQFRARFSAITGLTR